MRAKCKKCGNVFEMPWAPSLVHIGSLKYTKCPACGKRSMMDTNVSDPVTWPKEEQETKVEMTEEELRQKRIEESKYEKPRE